MGSGDKDTLVTCIGLVDGAGKYSLYETHFNWRSFRGI